MTRVHGRQIVVREPRRHRVYNIMPLFTDHITAPLRTTREQQPCPNCNITHHQKLVVFDTKRSKRETCENDVKIRHWENK